MHSLTPHPTSLEQSKSSLQCDGLKAVSDGPFDPSRWPEGQWTPGWVYKTVYNVEERDMESLHLLGKIFLMLLCIFIKLLRLPGEISITSDTQMAPPSWQKAKN